MSNAENIEPTKKPKDGLGIINAWAMAFGCMVGWGAFVMPSSTFLPVAGPLGSVVGMIIGTVIMLIIGANFVYLIKRSQRTGGIYDFTKEALGCDHAFLCSWFLCLSYLTIVFLNSTALFLVIRTVLNENLQTGYSYTVGNSEIYLGEVILSVLALIVVAFLFIMAGRVILRINAILVFVMLAGGIVAASVCLPHIMESSGFGSFAMGFEGINPVHSVTSIIILAPWAFVGFETISFDSPYYNFRAEKSKIIIFTTILASGIFYITFNLISICGAPDGFSNWAEYISSIDELSGIKSVPVFYNMWNILGNPGIAIIAVTAIAAIFTGIIGGYRATSRILSAMAEDNILSENFAKTPFSILFIMGISIVLSFLGRNTLNWFVDLTSFGAVISFGYTSVAAYKHAKSTGTKSVMITGVIGTIISAVFAVVQLIPKISVIEAMNSEAFLLLSLWCLLGFIFYWRTVKRSAPTEYASISTSGVVLFIILMYSVFMWFVKEISDFETISDIRKFTVWGGLVLIVTISVGLFVMLYLQVQVQKKNEATEREKIRAVESSLAKSQFLFNMSHDIRTPMNAIIGYTNFALKEDTSPKLREYLTKINSSGNHLMNLINDILEMSRIESGKVEQQFVPTDFFALFDELSDIFSGQAKQRNMDFSINTSSVRYRYVWCDPKSLSRALMNIISNAFKFTPDGGTVRVTLWEVGGDEDGYGTYEIRVQDSGIGMPHEFAQNKLFSAFERERTSTDSGNEGTGLGLSITKNLIDLMGGRIDVLTSPGNGTEMIIRLKLLISSEKEVKRSQQNTETVENPRNDFSSKRILVVEDNEINMEIATMMLSGYGFMLEKAVNGMEALKMVSSSEPGYYDAVLMDIQMPELDGYAATRAIRSLANPALSEIPVIAMTANAFKEDEQAAFDAGMQAHISKPIDESLLIKTLTDILM